MRLRAILERLPRSGIIQVFLGVSRVARRRRETRLTYKGTLSSAVLGKMRECARLAKELEKLKIEVASEEAELRRLGISYAHLDQPRRPFKKNLPGSRPPAEIKQVPKRGGQTDPKEATPVAVLAGLTAGGAQRPSEASKTKQSAEEDDIDWSVGSLYEDDRQSPAEAVGEAMQVDEGVPPKPQVEKEEWADAMDEVPETGMNPKAASFVPPAEKSALPGRFSKERPWSMKDGAGSAAKVASPVENISSAGRRKVETPAPGPRAGVQSSRPTKVMACTKYFFTGHCAWGPDCTGTHGWVNSLRQHATFKQLQEEGNLPELTREAMAHYDAQQNAKAFKKKTRRDFRPEDPAPTKIGSEIEFKFKGQAGGK